MSDGKFAAEQEGQTLAGRSNAPNYEELDLMIMERAGWRHPDDFPESLYHYTSSAAFLSILTTDELRFTDFRYLNDLSELRYGVALFDAGLIRRAEKERNDAAMTAMISAVREKFEAALIRTDIFVFCMCAENNLLNQWRVYGRDTVPISIEFATRGFLFDEWEPYDFELVPMVYDTALQEKIVDGAISAGLEYASLHKLAVFKDKESVQAYAEMFASICVGWCASMKHPQFAVEKEWRLSTLWGLEHRILRGRSFRASPIGIVPYLTLRPKAEEQLDATRLRIRSVTIGPCNQPELQKRTMHELLYQRVRADAEVHVSNLPLRV